MQPGTADGWDVLEHARRLRERGEPFALATVVWRRGPSSGKQGYRAVITPAGEVHGWIGGACAEPAVVREARHALEQGVPRLMFLGTPEDLETVGTRDGTVSVPISCQSEGALEVYIEPVEPEPHVVIVGRSPMVGALASMAGAIGWRAEVIDPDSQELDLAGVSERSLVVVATQGHHDEEATERALAAGPAYVGLVASQQRGASVLGYLRDRGIDEETLDRVEVPAGLDLGHVSHREIAVAILAELVQRKAAGALGGGTGVAVPTVEEATDPICGMTVEVASARHQTTHDGVTYYFCCAGCKRAFEEDPDAYTGAGATAESAATTESRS